MTRSRLAIPLSTCLLAAAILQGCGKKGPPLEPLVIVPERVSRVTARRFSDRVYVTFLVPSANTSGSEPADLESVEIYALTTQPGDTLEQRPPFDDWLDAASLVATISVRPPGATELGGESTEVSLDAGVIGIQGTDVTVVERLTPPAFVPVALEIDADAIDGAADRDDQSPGVLPLVGPLIPRPLRRTYVLRGVSTRGREGPPSPHVAVPLTESPDPPSAPIVTYTEDEVSVAWTPPLTARLPIQEPVADGGLEAAPIVEAQRLSAFDVYDVTEVADAEPTQEPRSLNRVALTGTDFTVREVTFGIERCYAVRMVDSVDGMEIRSRPSAPTCVPFVDTFPPAVPRGLIAVATEGAVSLVWDANSERDLAGYLLWRGRSLDATFEPLMAEPVTETTFRDVTVEAGASYEYAVQAVDQAVPPNVSPLSDRVVERAR